MKIWHTYGSEHSAQLVMIGRFKSETAAAEAHKVLTEIYEFLRANQVETFQAVRYPPEFQQLLESLKVRNLSVEEIGQFAFDVHATLDGDQVKIDTNEPDISAFLKVMVDRGARVEVFTTLAYPDDEKK